MAIGGEDGGGPGEDGGGPGEGAIGQERECRACRADMCNSVVSVTGGACAVHR